ncbi:hypothetical protein DPEC_G00067230 [Dallia pectoralis]|uniref:Uncharacterized protein n=1 Tax=Dallia pectoralis TaxID=75939 RepID=A0ACC2H985_DALPE|nr:hypothetical protein DPEC_G00067230 [Dallia pectoralis]
MSSQQYPRPGLPLGLGQNQIPIGNSRLVSGSRPNIAGEEDDCSRDARPDQGPMDHPSRGAPGFRDDKQETLVVRPFPQVQGQASTLSQHLAVQQSTTVPVSASPTHMTQGLSVSFAEGPLKSSLKSPLSSRVIAPANSHITLPAKVPSHVTVSMESTVPHSAGIPVATISGQQGNPSNVPHHLMATNVQIIRSSAPPLQLATPGTPQHTFTSHLPRGAAAAAVMSSSKGGTVLRPAPSPTAIQHILHQPIQSRPIVTTSAAVMPTVVATATRPQSPAVSLATHTAEIVHGRPGHTIHPNPAGLSIQRPPQSRDGSTRISLPSHPAIGVQKPQLPQNMAQKTIFSNVSAVAAATVAPLLTTNTAPSPSSTGSGPHPQMTTSNVVTMTMSSHSSHITAVTMCNIPVAKVVPQPIAHTTTRIQPEYPGDRGNLIPISGHRSSPNPVTMEARSDNRQSVPVQFQYFLPTYPSPTYPLTHTYTPITSSMSTIRQYPVTPKAPSGTPTQTQLPTQSAVGVASAVHLNQMQLMTVDRIAQINTQNLQPTAMATQNLQPTAMATQNLQPTAMATQNLQPTAMATQNLQPTAMATQNLQPTGMATQNLQPTAMATQNLQPTAMATQNLQPTAMATQNLQPTTMETQNHQPTAMATQNHQPTAMATHNLQPTTMATQNLQPTTMATQNLQPTTMATQNLQPTTMATQNLQPTTMATQNLQPTTMATQNLQPTTMATQNLQPTTMATQNLQPTTMATQNLQPTAMATQNLQPTVMATQNLQPTAMGTQNLQPTTMATQNLQPTAMATQNLQPTAMATQNLQPTAMATQNLQPTTISAQGFHPNIVGQITVKTVQQSTGNLQQPANENKTSVVLADCSTLVANPIGQTYSQPLPSVGQTHPQNTAAVTTLGSSPRPSILRKKPANEGSSVRKNLIPEAPSHRIDGGIRSSAGSPRSSSVKHKPDLHVSLASPVTSSPSEALLSHSTNEQQQLHGAPSHQNAPQPIQTLITVSVPPHSRPGPALTAVSPPIANMVVSPLQSAANSTAVCGISSAHPEIKIKQEVEPMDTSRPGPPLPHHSAPMLSGGDMISGASPRKKPRKQQHIISMEESEMMEANSTDEEKVLARPVSMRAEKRKSPPKEFIDEEGVRYVPSRARPPVTLLRHYRNPWKAAYHHFQRYSDIRVKEEKKGTLQEVANQKGVVCRAQGWKMHLSAAHLMELTNLERDVYSRLTTLQDDLIPKKKAGSDDDLHRINELIQGNMQRCKLVMDQITEARDTMMKVLDHKEKVMKLINKNGGAKKVHKLKHKDKAE